MEQKPKKADGKWSRMKTLIFELYLRKKNIEK